MAASTISCCLGPPAAPREASLARVQPAPQTTNAPWSGGSSLRRACVAAAACVVIGTAGGGGGGDAVLARDVPRPDDDALAAVAAQQAQAWPPRWSDRRQCPPWRANSLENIVPENLPRPSARRRYNSVAGADAGPAPALAPGAVAPFLALHSGSGCFSL